MKKYIIPLLVLVLAIPLLVIGCETPSTAAPTPVPLYVSTETFNTTVAQLQAAINGKANQADVTAQSQRIDNIAGRAGLSEADVNAKLSGYMKTSDFDAAVAKYLADHNITGGTGGSSGGGSTPSGDVVATNKDLALHLSKLNPDTDTLIVSSTQSIRFDFDVANNNSSSSRNFETTIYLYPEETEQAWVDGLDVFSDVSLAVTGTPAADPGSASINPIIIKCTSGWVGKGDITTFTVVGTVHTVTPAEFDYDYSIRQIN